MIEGPGGPASPRSPLRPFSFNRVGQELRARVGGAWRWVLPGQTHRESSDLLLWRLRLMERVFWLTLAGLALYLVVDLWVFQPKLPTVKLPATPPTTGEPAGTSTTSPAEGKLKPLAEYRETLVTRNPFGIAAQKIGEALGGEQVRNHLTELAGTLTVVGINRGRVQEALIEDTAAKRTFVVKVGDQINQLTVKSIDQNGAAVSYEGEETLLK